MWWILLIDVRGTLTQVECSVRLSTLLKNPKVKLILQLFMKIRNMFALFFNFFEGTYILVDLSDRMNCIMNTFDPI
ncbi:hypothetical protein HanHA300_Chr05g0164821 [Helianthus annuus]|nr:hypothetical protein HanHA300_Chr05g0164821 [Helianthus annuus]KAJ0583631.1 hypothetical protein HanHA89_Chr05g0178871 [Helianthus annuus]KAJ0749361.1 hypothetical protein HanLR1_Chr05g0168971 [Helianthus annuus]